jgi:hypothetical protein
MSTVVQTTYAPQIQKGTVGLIADETGYEVGTRLCGTSAGIGFGLAVSQSTVFDREAVIGGNKFVGITVRDVSLDRVPLDPLSTSSTPPTKDVYEYHRNMGILSRGRIWAQAHDDVVAGDPLYFDYTTGVLGNSSSGREAFGFVSFSSNPANNDTVTLNGTVITFKSSGATAASDQVAIGGTLAQTIENLLTFVNSETDDTNLNVATYEAFPPSPDGLPESIGYFQLNIAYATAGAGGNAYTLAASASTATLSGSTLAGGYGGVVATGSFVFDGVPKGNFVFSLQPASNSTITLNGTVVTFGTDVTIGVDLQHTLDNLVTFLTASVDTQIVKCTYTDDATHLYIVSKTAGQTNNSFTLAASTSPASHATRSGATLSDNPASGSTITLNGSVVTFGTDVTIGANLAATLATAKTFLNASADTQIVKCTYDTTGSPATTITVTEKTVGFAGNNYTLAASATSYATPSGATLTGGIDAAIAVSSGYWATTAQSGDLAIAILGLQE